MSDDLVRFLDRVIDHRTYDYDDWLTNMKRVRKVLAALRSSPTTGDAEERLRQIRQRAGEAHRADVEDWIEKHDALGVIVNICDAPSIRSGDAAEGQRPGDER